MGTNDEEMVLINVGLNAEEAEQGIQQLGQKINEVSKQDLGTTNVLAYKTQIRLLTLELQKIEQIQGRNSAAFQAGAKELGRLKLAALDFKQTIEAANPALGKFGALVPIAKGASVAMMGLAGAMGLFGVKGAKAEEVMLRLQSVLALSHALSGIHELTNGYRALIGVLGLTAAAAKKVNVAPGAAASVANTADAGATSAQAAAQERLSAARIAAQEAETDTQNALNAARAEGLNADVAMTGVEQAYLESAAIKKTALAELAAAQEAYNATLAQGTTAAVAETTATETQAAATEATTVATEGATGAATGLGIALKGIGIGLVITAIAFLVSNWDRLSKAVTDLFPALGKTKGLFKDFQNDLLGVGDVVLHIVKAAIEPFISGIKIIIDLIHGDFKGAMNDFKGMFKAIGDDYNVAKHFNAGKALGEAKDAVEANKIRVQAEIDANKRIIAERKALGEDVHKLEIKNLQLQMSILDKDEEEVDKHGKKHKKGALDLESEITVIQNQEIKKRRDEAERLRKEAEKRAEEERKSALEKYKSAEDDARKVILEGQRSQRDIELADAEFKYNKGVEAANRAGKSVADITEAYGIMKARINKKYDDQIFEYLDKLSEESLNEFDKKRLEIQKAVNDATRSATDEEKALVEREKAYQLAVVEIEEKLANKKSAASAAEIAAEDKNRAKIASAGKGDTPQETFDKEEAIRKAKLIALKANYDQEAFLARDNADKLKEIDAKFQKDKNDLEDEGTKARISLAESEQEAKIATFQTVSDAMGAAADLLGKSTVAGKALAVAQATISTYLAAQKAYESMAAIPVVGPGLGVVAAATAVASGLLNIKNILAVKVPGAGSSAGIITSYAAPTINSTVLNQAQQGVQQVKVTNQPDTKSQQPIKAYVVDRDISKVQDRAAYLDRVSTI